MRSARASSRAPTTSPRVASRWLWRSAAWQEASEPTSRSPAEQELTSGLFGEGPGGFLVSIPPKLVGRLVECTGARVIGVVGAAVLRIGLAGPAPGDAQEVLRVALEELRAAGERLSDLFA